MEKNRQWSELYFILYKDTLSLTLGGDKYRIKKDNSLFQSLTTFEKSTDEREIEIEVYIDHVSDLTDFQKFFEMSDSDTTYLMETYFNGNKYNCTIVPDDKPFEVRKIEDLYGTHTQPTATVKVSIKMESPFFYSDYSYDYNIGSSTSYLWSFPHSYGIGDPTYFVFGLQQELVHHIVDNTGNEDNGVIVTIISGRELSDPTIKNITTGLSTSFTLSVNANSTIVINTIDKTVYVNGVYKPNVKNLFDKWLQLIEGKNVIEFESNSGSEYANVEVKFFNKYRALN